MALECKRQAMESKIAALRAEFATEKAETQRLVNQEQQREQRLTQDRQEMGRRRGGEIPLEPIGSPEGRPENPIERLKS